MNLIPIKTIKNNTSPPLQLPSQRKEAVNLKLALATLYRKKNG